MTRPMASCEAVNWIGLSSKSTKNQEPWSGKSAIPAIGWIWYDMTQSFFETYQAERLWRDDRQASAPTSVWQPSWPDEDQPETVSLGLD